MATTQYIGARYVPLFADPAEWDSTKQYEPLTIVIHKGNSYTSRQYVPAGIEITNEKFWALTGNYNAQIEQYRSEVATFDDRITTNETNLRNILPFDETPTEGSDKGVTSDGIKKAIDTAEQTNADAIAIEVTRAKEAEQTNADAIAIEVTRAKEAEQTNADAIAIEVTRAKESEQTNADAIAIEVARAKGAEQALQTSISDKMCSNDIAICSPEFIMDEAFAEGFCFKKINGIVHFWLAKVTSYTPPSSSVTIYHYANGSKVNEATFSTIGHANQICYADGKLYVAGVGLDDDAPISVIDAQTLKPLSTIDIHVWALDYYDGHFYAISAGDRIIRKYKPDFSSYEELHIDWTSLDVGQTICVWDNGIIILQNQHDDNIGWANVLQFFGKDGTKQKLMTTQTCDEIEQICFSDGMFMCASNAYGKTIVSSINVNGYNGSASYTEKMFYYAKSNMVLSDRIAFYVDYSSGEFGDGSESRPWNSIIPLVNISEYFPQIKILFKGDSGEDFSLYNGCKKVTIECIDSDRKRAPRVNGDFSVKYVNCIYDKEGFGRDCRFTFTNCTICPSGPLFYSSSAANVLFDNCTFDYTNKEWKVLNNGCTRPISIKNLSLKGDGKTEYDRNTSIGCHAKVYCYDVLSSIIFMAADVGLDIQNESTIDKCFSWGVNQCGWFSNAAHDAYFNLSAASPDRCLQYKIGADSTLKYRFIGGCQKITIDSSGNVNYPHLNLGEWH